MNGQSWTFAKLASMAAASGGTLVAYAAASPKALEDLSAITPTPGNAFVMLMVTGLTYLIKNYVPSEKDMKGEFTEIKVGHRSLMTKIGDLALDTRSHRETTAAYRVELAEQIGGIHATVKSIDARQDRMENRLGHVEKKVGTGTFPKPDLSNLP